MVTAEDPANLDIHRQISRWLPDRQFARVLVIGAGSGNDAALALSQEPSTSMRSRSIR